MLSRVASSVYWMSRYVERAENVARFIHVNINLLLDYPEEKGVRQWEPLIITSGDDKDFLARYSEANEKNVINFLAFDKDNPNSILSCIKWARENGRSIRDTISSEMWRELNQLYLMLQKQSRAKEIKDPHKFFTSIKNSCHLFAGISDAVMSHGEAWHFARLGRFLERADKTARILDVKFYSMLPTQPVVANAYDSILWGALLKSASAQEMYRKKFNRTHYKSVVEFLVFDKEFPRSLLSCVRMALLSLKKITFDIQTQPAVVGELRKIFIMLKRKNSELIIQQGLHQFIDEFQTSINSISDQINQCFFALKNPVHKPAAKILPNQVELVAMGNN